MPRATQSHTEPSASILCVFCQTLPVLPTGVETDPRPSTIRPITDFARPLEGLPGSPFNPNPWKRALCPTPP